MKEGSVFALLNSRIQPRKDQCSREQKYKGAGKKDEFWGFKKSMCASFLVFWRYFVDIFSSPVFLFFWEQ